MLESQRTSIEMSEVREQINGLSDDASADEYNALTKTYGQLEARYRAALITESTYGGGDADSDAQNDPEAREIRHLIERSGIADFVSEAATEREIDGAARELRSATLGDDVGIGYMPLQMLLDPEQDGGIEHRADAVSNHATAIQDNQMPIAARVFPRSSVAYLGVSTPSVPVGTTTYPRLTGGTTADVRSEGVELDGAAATLETESVNPVRLTASYTFGLETLSRVKGYEEALRRDIRAVLEDKRDSLAINGQAASGSDSPKVDGIISSLTDPTNPTDVATWQTYLTAYDDLVDGKYAMSDEDVRLLTNVDVWKHAMGLQIETSGDLLRDRLDRTRFRSSANMPSTASTIATAIAYAAGAPARGFVMPTWAGLQMVVDPYTGAKAGQRILTAIMMTGFQMIDSAAYRRVEFKVAT